MTAEAGGKAFEELKAQMNMRSLKLSSDAEGKEATSQVLRTSKLMMRDMKDSRRKRLYLTCCAVYLGDDVRIIDWKKKGRNGRQ